ncbi:MAG: hypothetical protein ABEJ60_06450 [Halodesulfurarchaeum sp.]
MRTRTLAILLVVVAALLPTWFAATQAGHHVEEAGIDTDETAIRPLQEIIDTPNALTPAEVGVVIWVALGALLALLAGAHRFMAHGVRPSTDAPGEHPAWMDTEDRRVATAVGAVADNRGLLAIVALGLVVVAFSALTVTEFLTLARTQYAGVYVGGTFFGLAGLVIAYYGWFMPHVTVAEERYHD